MQADEMPTLQVEKLELCFNMSLANVGVWSVYIWVLCLLRYSVVDGPHGRSVSRPPYTTPRRLDASIALYTPLQHFTLLN